MTDFQTIRDAWYENQKRRPDPSDPEVLRAITPPGGEWTAEADVGAITRSVRWGLTEVCLVNPNGSLGDTIEGDITMGLRATPVMDTALRAIMSLSGDPANMALIRKIAMTAIAYVEMPAPHIHLPHDEDEPEEQDEGCAP